jgi:hypothetical protein
LQSSELSKSIYRGASICRKGDGKKVKKVGRERNLDRNGIEKTRFAQGFPYERNS